MDFAPPVPIMTLNDGTRDSQLIWELAQHCDVLLEDKRKLISHCRRTLESQDDLRKLREPAEANLVAANEHFRLKVIGLMADLAHIEGERDEMNVSRKEEAALNVELRSELNASLEEKARVDENLAELTQQMLQQIDERNDATAHNDMLSEKLEELESRWQIMADKWVAEKSELIRRSSESQSSDLQEIADLQKSYADAKNNVTWFKKKTTEMTVESDQLREERDELKEKAASLSMELTTIQAALEDKKAENAKLRNDEFEALSEREREVSELQLAITRVHEEKDECIRASRKSEFDEQDAALKYENKSLEHRQMELQYKNTERISREMEKQLNDVKRAYSRLEESLRRQSLELETRGSESSSRLSKREASTAELKGKLLEQLTEIGQIRDTEVSTQEEEKASRELVAAEKRNDGDARLIEALTSESDATLARLKSFSDLFLQLEAGFDKMPNWLSFQAEFFQGEKATSWEELTIRFLKFLKYAALEITELEDNLVATVDKNAALQQLVVDSKVAFENCMKTAETSHLKGREEIERLMNDFSKARSERDVQKRLARKRHDKLRRIKEMILLWMNQQELVQLSEETLLVDSPGSISAYPTFEQIIEELSSS
eukprot:GEMP01021078.1.p1 GENE.GEMP01021078.1~~GEMP01021078.1.p1  ORF type:complete len:610 (+),score=180.46 GEMP01021078.1:137-1966(+)